MGNAMMGGLLIGGSVLSDVAANILLKKSDGFKRRLPGVLALACVGLAFLLLAEALKYMDLSIAYSLFGAFGIILTTLVDKLFFKLQINLFGVAGLAVMISGIIMLKML